MPILLVKSITGVGVQGLRTGVGEISYANAHVVHRLDGMQLTKHKVAVVRGESFIMKVEGYISGFDGTDQVSLNVLVTNAGYTMAGWQVLSPYLEVGWERGFLDLVIPPQQDVFYSLTLVQRGGELVLGSIAGRKVTALP